MSSFPAGSVQGVMRLDDSQWKKSWGDAEGKVQSFPGVWKSGFVNPVAQGMLQSQAIMRLFPSQVQSFLANPLLGLADTVRSVFRGIKGAILDVVDQFDNFSDMADRYGVAPEFLSSIAPIASSVGASIEGLGQGLAIMQRQQVEAARGSATAAAAFQSLGIAIRDSRGNLRGTEDLFFDVAEAIRQLPTAAERTSAAMQLMGRGGTELIPVLRMGSAQLREYMEVIRSVGGATSAEAGRMAGDFVRLQTVGSAAWFGLKAAIATPFLQWVSDNFKELQQTIIEMSAAVRPVLEELFNGFLKPALEELMKYLRERPGEAKQRVVEAVNAIVGALKAMGSAMAWVVRNGETLIKVLGGLLTLLAAGSLVGAVRNVGGALAGLGGIMAGASGSAARAAGSASAAGAVGAAATPVAARAAGAGFAGRIAGPLIGAGAIYAGERMSGSSQGESVGSAIGGFGGWMAGAKVGAIGGSIFGPLGTAIGGILGGIIGGLVGSSAGKAAGGLIDPPRQAAANASASDAMATAASGASDAMRTLTEAATAAAQAVAELAARAADSGFGRGERAWRQTEQRSMVAPVNITANVKVDEKGGVEEIVDRLRPALGNAIDQARGLAINTDQRVGRVIRRLGI